MRCLPFQPSRWTQEVRREQDQLQTYSAIALRNMLAYCQARVVQLNDQHEFLDILSRQEGDLYALCRMWQRMERIGCNSDRFREQCLIIQLELARRRQTEETVRSQRNDHETR